MTSITEIRSWRFALVGTPNSGKTALFNALTGSRQKVANYPGVTVERKTGTFQTSSGHRIDLFDLPGTYSLRGRSPDEEVTRDMVLGRIKSEAQPDLLLCVADATNLRVALRLVTELERADGGRSARGAARGRSRHQGRHQRTGAARHADRPYRCGVAASGRGARHPARRAVRDVPGRVRLGAAGD